MAEKKKMIVEPAKTDVERMIDGLVEKAQKALAEFLTLDQDTVDNIVHEMALAGLDKHQELARMAVDETGRGVYEDKVIKNMFATEYIWHNIKAEKTVGILEENDMEGYVEVAEPVGVICGVTPTTNPPSTPLFKCLIAVKTRNASFVGFHPSAQNCSAEAARIVYEAAVKAGAPENCIQWITEPSVEVDVSCFECHGKGCPLCKHTGWIEVLGGGVVNRKVLENCNIDPDEYSGFAFGIGIERIAMLKYGINNIGLMFENNLQFLKQFHE